jgi:hypothetical protein
MEMEQKYLTEAQPNNDEYERQAPFEISVNKIMDSIDNAIVAGNPILSEITALYLKCAPFLKNKEIDDLYTKIYKDKNRIYNSQLTHYQELYGRPKLDNSEKWIKYVSQHKLVRGASIIAYRAIETNCKKIYGLIVENLIAHKLILLSKKELESSHE